MHKNTINWVVRFKNKQFVLSLVSAIILGVQGVATTLGYQVNFNSIENTIVMVVNAVFAVFAITGIIQDPTTKGIGDSQQALEYSEPKGG